METSIGLVILDQILIIYTDHKNLICKNNNIDRLFRWRLILEDYGPDIEYIQGHKNIVADSLSRLTINGNQKTTHKYTLKSKLCQK